MESDCRERELLYTPGLYCGAGVVDLKSCDGLVQEIGGSDCSCKNHCSPDNSGAPSLAGADINKPMDCSGFKKFINSLQYAHHGAGFEA